MESELSATEKMSEEPEKLLGLKRSSRSLRDNFLFRRVMNGKILGKYEKVSNAYFHMMNFNWEDERISKVKSNMMSNLNAMAYWFYICSDYYPYCSNQFLDKPLTIPENIGRIVEKIIINKRDLKKKSNISTKNKYIDDLYSVINEEEDESRSNNNDQDDGEKMQVDLVEEERVFAHINPSTDRMIEIMENKLDKITERNKTQFQTMISNLSSTTGSTGNIRDEVICSDINTMFNYDPEDILNDMHYRNPYSEEFKKYLIRKNEEKASNPNTGEEFILSRAEEEMNSNPDDIVCVVCNDGDYEDNDLIVYCSVCQMTVHQSCYGIVTLPKDDWICYPCLCFGLEKGKEAECVLCPVKGGAMKPCNIKKSGQFYAYLLSLRLDENRNNINASMSNYLNLGNKNSIFLSSQGQSQSQSMITINLPNSNDNLVVKEGQENGLKEESISNTSELEMDSVKSSKLSKTLTSIKNPNKDDDASVSVNITNTPYTEKKELETNKQTIVSNSSPKKRGRRKGKFSKNKNKQSDEILRTSFNEYINPKIANENAWVHLSCALWLPDVIIEDYPKKELIKNIENIEKKKFSEICCICKLSGYGPTLKCENEKCSLRFHVECARINKHLLEKVNNYSGEIKFYIYCQIHRPHKLIKNMELCKQRTIDDINHFAEILNKNYDMLNKLDKKNDFSVFTPRRYGLYDPEKKNKSGGIFNIYSGGKSGNTIKDNEKRVSKESISKKDSMKIVRAVRETALRLSNLNVNVKIKDENDYEVIQPKKEKITISFVEVICPLFFPWYLIKQKTNINLTPAEIYRVFRELVPNDLEYSKQILRKSENLSNNKKSKGKGKLRLGKGKSKNKVKSDQVLQPEEDSLPVYCYCKKPFIDGEFMIKCEYGDEEDITNNRCINNGWVHQLCVEELRNTPREVIEDENYRYACKECQELFGKII